MRLTTGFATVDADDALVTRAAAECRFDHFHAHAQKMPLLAIEITNEIASPDGTLSALDRKFGTFAISDGRIRVRTDDSTLAAIATVRLAWHVLVQRAGGVLLHAGAVGFGEQAVIATGMSGAGKSTLTSYLVDAGGTLLSDEIVAVFPDGSVRGTPFRSDLDLPGAPQRFRIGAVLLLAKGADERIESVTPRELIHTAISQVFAPEGAGLTRGDALERLTSGLSHARIGRLTFRKDAAAGRFVRDWLNAARE